MTLADDDTAVIVLNWNGREDSIRCLTSLREHGRGCRVVFVDNGSSDESVDAVRRRFADVVIIELASNQGFSAGNNAGISWALDEGFSVVGILNNDTVVTEGFLDPLLAAIDPAPATTYASPQIRYLGEPDKIWFAGAATAGPGGIFVHRSLDTAHRPDVDRTPMATGCALFAHRSVWERVGPLDDRYFLIFEDADWCARANALGCEGVVANRSVILHAVSSTFESQSSPGDYYYTRNGLLFLRTHSRRRGRSIARFLGSAIRFSLRTLRRRRTLASLATPVLQVRAVIDVARGEVGQLVPGPLTSWAIAAGSARSNAGS